ncbi:hypothetical protein PUV54_03315 [Hyphococcus flavus]|uniref:Uncharacterized protein n=1 Tax=Hyphococcus flavus TaxID=1866326 RepID=A0AAE9ZCY0_9PROT|nr:hypothetical protein [Hyphococcus flavus]WDI32221.1 hypothetical protein PUV54_03315 [Hyphococcus flavus]
MKNRLINSTVLALLFAAAPLAAHAGKIKTITAPMEITMSQADNASSLASMWEDGKRQEYAGLALIEDAQKLDKSARKDLRKAEEKQAKFTAISEDRRAQFVTVSGRIGLAKTPGEGASAMKLADKALDDWKDDVEALGKATDRVREAEARIAAAASALRNGEEQVALGREKMRRAENKASGVSGAEAHPAQAQSGEKYDFVDMR